MKKILLALLMGSCGIHLYSMELSNTPNFLKKVILSNKWTPDEAKKHIEGLDAKTLNQFNYFLCVSPNLPDYEDIFTYKSGFALLHVVIDKNKWKFIESFYKAGANLCIKPHGASMGITPLELAYQKKHWLCVIELLKAGVNSKHDPMVFYIIKNYKKDTDGKIQTTIRSLLEKNESALSKL